MSSSKILFVDDDANILRAVERQFEGKFDIQLAAGSVAGLKAVENDGPFAIVFSDMRMPEMTGIDFLNKVQDIAPNSIRMMLTSFADLETTINAINKGHIFRFLSKPCDKNTLQKAIEDGLRQYRLVVSEKELLEGTLMGSVKVLSEVLSLVNPSAFGRASRVQRIATTIAEHMQFENIWELRIASMLCEIGCVSLPAAILNKLSSRAKLSSEEMDAFKRHPDVGRSLLSNIPRLENVAEIVAYQEKNFDGSGFPVDKKLGQDLPLGARILKVALDFDIAEQLVEEPLDAYSNMLKNGHLYDPIVLSSLENVLDQLSTLERQKISLNSLRSGMILAEDVKGQNEQLLVSKGQEITPSILRFLFNYVKHSKLEEPMTVLCQSSIEPELV